MQACHKMHYPLHTYVVFKLSSYGTTGVNSSQLVVFVTKKITLIILLPLW